MNNQQKKSKNKLVRKKNLKLMIIILKLGKKINKNLKKE